MRIYLDSSAIVKLVQEERETAALRSYLGDHGTDGTVTSALARVEVVRAVAPGGAPAVEQARRQLGRIAQVTMTADLLDAAAELAPSERLRNLDAIPLVSVSLLGTDLRSVVTYDQAMAEAAGGLGLATVAPGAGGGSDGRDGGKRSPGSGPPDHHR